MRWRSFLIDGPAAVVDVGWRAYWTVIAALVILCFVNVGLTLLAYWLGYPLP